MADSDIIVSLHIVIPFISMALTVVDKLARLAIKLFSKISWQGYEP
jgi:hypothetical protein